MTLQSSLQYFLKKKVTRIVGETAVNQNVYNGRIKMAADPLMFTTSPKISECIKNKTIDNLCILHSTNNLLVTQIFISKM